MHYLALSLLGVSLVQGPSAQLDLEVSGITPPTGKVMVALFDSEEGYNSNNVLTGVRLSLEGETLSYVFQDLEPGTYAIKMYHDVDGDESLDRNVLGIPTEPVAFSNNAPVRFGPPGWDAAAFEVEAGENHHAVTF